MISVLILFKEDPTLERHFKGHRDTVTSVDFNPNMKQLGKVIIILSFLIVFHQVMQTMRVGNTQYETSAKPSDNMFTALHA